MTTEEQLKNLILNCYDSMKSFAEASQLPNSTLDSIFRRGVNNASVTNIIKICRTLNISVDALGEGQIKRRQLNKREKAPLAPLERKIVTTVRKMTPPGQQAVLDYAEFCAAKPEYQRPAETMPFAARARGGLTGEKNLTPKGEAAWDEMQDEGSDPTP